MNSFEPDRISPGETIEWRKSSDYSAGDGWALTYYFRNASGTGFNATGTASGSSWEVSVVVPPTVGAGRIDWEAWVSKAGEEHLVDKGVATVEASLKALAANAAHDGRTQAERDLEAVRAALVPASAAGVMEYEIGGPGSNRRIRYFGKQELLALETKLAQRVNSEKRKARRREGGPRFKTFYLR